MQEVFEEIIEKLKSESHWTESTFDEDGYCNDDSEEVVYLHNAIEIVKQEAEKFGTDTNVGSNGWIPCSERLPLPHDNVLISTEGGGRTIAYMNANFANMFWDMYDNAVEEVVAWQPLPQPYQPKGE